LKPVTSINRSMIKSQLSIAFINIWIRRYLPAKHIVKAHFKAAAKNDTKQLRILLDRKSRSGTARANYHKNGRRAIHLIALNGTANSLELAHL